uniref:Uncharacterized protein n=1 Tax=Anguilla anguilla TaxID=7936 RepID=A0A0E9TPQ8_ANGAN
MAHRIKEYMVYRITKRKFSKITQEFPRMQPLNLIRSVTSERICSR